VTRLARPIAAVLTAALVAAACTSSTSSVPGTFKDGPNTLNILAGSELKDMVPILDEARKATGVKVNLTYVGSLDGAEQIAAGTKSDAAWFGSDKYLGLAGASTKILAREKIASAPSCWVCAPTLPNNSGGRRARRRGRTSLARWAAGSSPTR
jgi:Ca-activated chloride channel family protein